MKFSTNVLEPVSLYGWDYNDTGEGVRLFQMYGKLYAAFGAGRAENAGNAFEIDKITEVIHSKNSLLVGGIAKNTSKGTSYRKIWFFKDGFSPDYTFQGKVYYIKILEKGKPIIDLIPCYRVIDGIIGFYDKVRGKFYINKGTGTFQKGPNKNLEFVNIGNYANSIKRSSGKNLFDKNNEIITGYTFGATNNMIQDPTFFYQNEYIQVEPNTTYTVKRPRQTSLRICEYDNNKNFIQRNYEKYTITTTENTHYIRISDRIVAIDYIQFEKGEQPTEPQPSGVGKWYIEKQVEKIILNGTETWTYASTYPRFESAQIPDVDPTAQRIIIASDRFKYISSGTSNGGAFTYGKKFFLYNFSQTNINDFKEWLATNKPIFYYHKANTEYEEITNEELINQLNEIQNLQMQQGETNIYWTGEVAPEMKLQYATNEELHDYIITEDGKRIRTDWRSIGRREKWTTK